MGAKTLSITTRGIMTLINKNMKLRIKTLGILSQKCSYAKRYALLEVIMLGVAKLTHFTLFWRNTTPSKWRYSAIQHSVQRHSSLRY